MRRPLSILYLLLLALGCGGSSDLADNQSEWRTVLERKKLASSPSATPADRQVYADTLAAFVGKHPSHGRAREVYHRIQLDFAHELASLGRHQDAIRFYRAVLAADPTNDDAERGLAASIDHLAVSRAKLLALEKGMKQKEVARILGKPIPGWTLHREHRDTAIDAWYYRKTDGGVAGVYFRDGELFAAEENSHAKLASLTPGR